MLQILHILFGFTISILNEWKKKTGLEKPKLILLNTSGGGSRAMMWTYYTLHYLDSIYQQEFFNVGLEIALENTHRDYFGSAGSVLQSPFTEKNVGGYMYRHGNLLETDPLIRKEGYQGVYPYGRRL